MLFDGQRIEGIGNEVVIACIVVIIGLFSLLYFVYRFTRRSTAIHPSSRDVVETVRQRLTQLYSNRFAARTESEGQDNNQEIDYVQLNHYGMDNQCPVCLNEPNHPVETNCGHLFCAQCIIVYWRHGTWRGPVPCPVCRQVVSVLLVCFRNPRNEDQQELQEMLHDINDYNRRFSGGPRPWLDYLWDLPTLLRHLSSEFFTVGGLMYMFRIRIVLCFVAAIMYLISPLDMIPEAVFGILGLLDDIFVVLLLAIYVTIIYRRFLANRWEEESL
ncbi:RING finger protein 170-like protein [Leptotrombidium deliense]|uniref:E3 ubiquitin-protein ligase RNF170 n=1 Tax=Leptotrombidium deliense TaxID=299467 RepID=A0A443SLZ1_9ACAR|nr:RING finger protein 170-like protein [Leptotrombidium deliense]